MNAKKSQDTEHAHGSTVDQSRIEIDGNPNTTQIAVVMSIFDRLITRFTHRGAGDGARRGVGSGGGVEASRIEASVMPDHLLAETGQFAKAATVRTSRSRWGRSADAIAARTGFSDNLGARRWQEKR